MRSFSLRFRSKVLRHILKSRYWKKFNEDMAKSVEAAYQDRATNPSPTLDLLHPVFKKRVWYKYDFATVPMAQQNTSTGFTCQIRRGAERGHTSNISSLDTALRDPPRSVPFCRYRWPIPRRVRNLGILGIFRRVWVMPSPCDSHCNARNPQSWQHATGKPQPARSEFAPRAAAGPSSGRRWRGAWRRPSRSAGSPPRPP